MYTIITEQNEVFQCEQIDFQIGFVSLYKPYIWNHSEQEFEKIDADAIFIPASQVKRIKYKEQKNYSDQKNRKLTDFQRRD